VPGPAELITLKIALPANRDYLGALWVLDGAGKELAGPYRIAARASDDIAAEHGNPTRASTLPFGDPPLGSYRLCGMAGTGEGTRYRRDLFGPLDVIILNGTGGHAALADANGRFEIVIHGGPLAANGGLRASTGHFRISDPDLAAVSALIRQADSVACVCEQAAGDVAVDVVSDLYVAAVERSVERPPPPKRRKPRLRVPDEYLVAFGEYSSGGPNVDTSLTSSTIPQPGQQRAACMGMETICQTTQYTAAQSQDSTVNPYTGAQYPWSPLLADPYSGGPSPFFPNGQPYNAYNGAPSQGGTSGASRTGSPTGVATAPSQGGQSNNTLGGQSNQPYTGGQANNAASLLNPNVGNALSAFLNAGTRTAFGPNVFGVGPSNSGLSPYLPNGLDTNSFLGGQQTSFASPIPRIESANAWNNARASSSALAALQEQVDMGFLDPALVAPGANVATATAQTSRSMTTSIRAQTAEVSGYDARLSSGEIGIRAPSGSNIPGPDYITATQLPSGDYVINVVDTKSRVTANPFGDVPGSLPSKWESSVDEAVSQLSLKDPAAQQGIQDAWAEGRVNVVRDTVDYSVQGQGSMEVNDLAIPIDTPITDPALTPPVVEPPASPTLAPGNSLENLESFNSALGGAMLGFSVGMLAGQIIDAPEEQKAQVAEEGILDMLLGFVTAGLSEIPVFIPKSVMDDMMYPGGGGDGA
jgi:hypothetical protein